MNNQQLIAVKQVYDSLGELMGSPYLQMEFMRKFPQINIQVKDILYMESLRYMIYIANADDYISTRELNIINYVTGRYLTTDLVDELIEEDPDFYINSMPEVPLTVKIMCEVENSIYRSNNALESSILKTIITYFEALTMVVINADNDVTYGERNRAIEFIDMIKEYAEENTLSPFWGLDDED